MSGVEIPAKSVRWHEFAGMRPWVPCDAVEFTDGWLIVYLDRDLGDVMAVPNHIVRGRVEISMQHERNGS